MLDCNNDGDNKNKRIILTIKVIIIFLSGMGCDVSIWIHFSSLVYMVLVLLIMFCLHKNSIKINFKVWTFLSYFIDEIIFIILR